MSKRALILLAAPVFALSLGGAAMAQTTGQDSLQQILGAVLGQVTSMDAQWQRGQRPLNAGRAQFQARLDADVRARTLTSQAADRMGADYDGLVTLETQYGADGSYSAQERTDLRNRYDALTQTYSEGGPAVAGPTAAQGEAAFSARVEAAVNARTITRTEATSLRNDYAGVVQLETSYARNGISTQERADLDTRLDALDRRLPNLPPPPVQVSLRDRLDRAQNAIPAALRSRLLTASQAAELRVEIGDLQRLDAAYARTRPSADDTTYLQRRVGEVEARTRRAGR
ncbi:MAG: hypothetical protein JWM33_996 [Caulobacteraceae bacterium]|nr:hypothetical protein [Caulobacteraceae bacterium]